LLKQKFGARVVIEGAHIGEAKEYAENLSDTEGLTYINGFDDPEIVAGAGTMGIEMIDEVPCVDAVVVPVGGAGLIAGVACAVKTLKPDCKVNYRKVTSLHQKSFEKTNILIDFEDFFKTDVITFIQSYC
jgi:threonine dehydratase